MTAAPAAHALRPRAGSSAKALLLTILGEFVLPHGGAAWTSTIVGSLAALDVEERNARQAVGRLAEQGLVGAEKRGRKAHWQLTDRGRRLLTDGTERIYQFGAAADGWDGRWLVVLSSVPERQRAKRHQLRTKLGFAGFGFLAPGVAVSPHVEREQAATAVLGELGLRPGAVVLRAEASDTIAADDLLRRAWDLDSLAAAYDGFVADVGELRPRTDEACFAALVGLVHAWRRFPFVDPELPSELLAPSWPGRRAKALFDAKHTAWSPAANRWYEQLEAGGH